MDKSILTEEDINNLKLEEKALYNSFISTLNESGIINKNNLEKFFDIIREQYYNGALRDQYAKDNYTYVFAKNVENIINIITNYRNRVIAGKKVFDSDNFGKINNGLNDLKAYINHMSMIDRYFGSLETFITLLKKVDTLIENIEVDINSYSGYKEEKNTAIDKYNKEKEKYESLSSFGKFTYKLTGMRSYKKAQKEFNYYNESALMGFNNNQDGIINPPQYNDYLERQNGGNSR